MHLFVRPVPGGAVTQLPGAAAAAVAATAASLLVSTGGVADVVSAAAHMPLEFWVLAVLAVLAEVRLFPAIAASGRLARVFISVCFTFAIALLWGAAWAILVQ